MNQQRQRATPQSSGTIPLSGQQVPGGMIPMYPPGTTQAEILGGTVRPTHYAIGELSALTQATYHERAWCLTQSGWTCHGSHRVRTFLLSKISFKHLWCDWPFCFWSQEASCTRLSSSEASSCFNPSSTAPSSKSARRPNQQPFQPVGVANSTFGRRWRRRRRTWTCARQRQNDAKWRRKVGISVPK